MKITCRIEKGSKFWRNEKGQIHRVKGPAIEWKNGDKYWCQNNELHRLYGPAKEYANGDKEWYQNGLEHRIDGPAIEYVDGDKEYSYNDIYYPEIKTDEEWKRFIKLVMKIRN